MSPPLPILILSFILILLIPILTHIVTFRKSARATIPSILIAGPSGSGKTSLQTLFEHGKPAETQTSQAPLAVECSLPDGTMSPSDRFRSTNDPTAKASKEFYLIDTPGHAKLRYYAWDTITKPQNLRGIIFMVDAANLSAGEEGLQETSEYLHDTLLILQKRSESSKSSRPHPEIPILVAANKLDLFTALPVTMVKSTLESEITKIRASKDKGLLSSGNDAADNDDWLGSVGTNAFKFSQMEEFDIHVDFEGGNILGGEGEDVRKWWAWVGDRL